METRKAGVLIGLENREGLRAVGVRSSPPLPNNGEHSLMGKLHTVNVAYTGSSPVVHPKHYADIVQLLERGVASAGIWIGVPLSAPNNSKGLASREVP